MINKQNNNNKSHKQLNAIIISIYTTEHRPIIIAVHCSKLAFVLLRIVLTLQVLVNLMPCWNFVFVY